MAAYLIVEAEVEEESREAFDLWYENEHLPDAIKAFEAEGPSAAGAMLPQVFISLFTKFPNLERARAIASSEAIKTLIAEFDRLWDGKVTAPAKL